MWLARSTRPPGQCSGITLRGCLLRYFRRRRARKACDRDERSLWPRVVRRESMSFTGCVDSLVGSALDNDFVSSRECPRRDSRCGLQSTRGPGRGLAEGRIVELRPKGGEAGLPPDGRGWVRTRDPSRVRRSTSRCKSCEVAGDTATGRPDPRLRVTASSRGFAAIWARDRPLWANGAGFRATR
jgi:hypothetical protein